MMDRDTLNGIALKFDTTPGKIASLNKFSLSVSAPILPGQVSSQSVVCAIKNNSVASAQIAQTRGDITSIVCYSLLVKEPFHWNLHIL